MQQPLIIKYRWTADELVDASRFHYRHSMHPVVRGLLHLGFALVFVTGTFLLVTRRSIAFGFIATFAGFYWFLLVFGRETFARRHFEKSPDRNQEFEWNVFPDRLTMRCDLAQSEFKWESLAKVVRTPRGFLLYFTKRNFGWLPAHGFTDGHDVEQLSCWAKSKVQQYTELT